MYSVTSWVRYQVTQLKSARSTECSFAVRWKHIGGNLKVYVLKPAKGSRGSVCYLNGGNWRVIFISCNVEVSTILWQPWHSLASSVILNRFPSQFTQPFGSFAVNQSGCVFIRLQVAFFNFYFLKNLYKCTRHPQWSNLVSLHTGPRKCGLPGWFTAFA